MPEAFVNAQDRKRWQRELKQAPKERVSEFTRYLLPHFKPIKKLEKAERKADADLNIAERRACALKTQTALEKSGRTLFLVEDARMNTKSYMLGVMNACPEEFLEKACFINEQGTVVEQVLVKAEEVKKAVGEGKRKATRNAELPIAMIGLATLAIWAICSIFGVSLAGIFGTIGFGVMAFMALSLGFATLILDKIYSRRERALSVWDKAVARAGMPSRAGDMDEGAHVPAPPVLPGNAGAERLFPGQMN